MAGDFEATMAGMMETAGSCFAAISNFSTAQLRFAPETFIVIAFFCITLLFCLCYLPIMFCCSRSKKEPGSPYTRRDVICKKGLFALMLARVDEFDTLTPLIATPTSQLPNPLPQLSRPTLPQASHVTTSDSPPPPRRSHHGKTLIVPLNASRYRVPVTPLLGTPDSRITSFEAGTTKSCATIPEDDEDESPSCERIDDLISIDRTTASASDQKSHRAFYSSYSSYNIILPVAPPEFQSSSSFLSAQIPVPTYSPPSLPRNQSRPRQLPRETRTIPSSSDDQSPCTNSIGSPNSTGSPIDTTGSISDTFYINSDVISSANGSGSQVADEHVYAESEVQSKYQLHRLDLRCQSGYICRNRSVIDTEAEQGAGKLLQWKTSLATMSFVSLQFMNLCLYPVRVRSLLCHNASARVTDGRALSKWLNCLSERGSCASVGKLRPGNRTNPVSDGRLDNCHRHVCYRVSDTE